ncbi:MAG: RNHCP domain-containing protein [Phycisphaerae bacterium]|jgi:hypothetical protein
MSKHDHQRRHESDGFTCIHCKLQVPGQAWGTKHRNHCPACLYSRHVDDTPGDRASPCKAPMMPIALEVRGAPHLDHSASSSRGGLGSGEWAIIHRCTACGVLKVNRIAGDDSERTLLALALRPLANPAFPLDGFR